jgi:hypothetical protein
MKAIKQRNDPSHERDQTAQRSNNAQPRVLHGVLAACIRCCWHALLLACAARGGPAPCPFLCGASTTGLPANHRSVTDAPVRRRLLRLVLRPSPPTSRPPPGAASHATRPPPAQWFCRTPPPLARRLRAPPSVLVAGSLVCSAASARRLASVRGPARSLCPPLSAARRSLDVPSPLDVLSPPCTVSFACRVLRPRPPIMRHRPNHRATARIIAPPARLATSTPPPIADTRTHHSRATAAPPRSSYASHGACIHRLCTTRHHTLRTTPASTVSAPLGHRRVPPMLAAPVAPFHGYPPRVPQTTCFRCPGALCPFKWRRIGLSKVS